METQVQQLTREHATSEPSLAMPSFPYPAAQMLHVDPREGRLAKFCGAP